MVIAVILAIVDLVGWRVVSRMFDRERLITGKRAISVRVEGE